MKEIKIVKVDDCIPMAELERNYYDDLNYRYLKRVIERDGLDPAYPIRVIWNNKKQKFEIFDGVHRWRIAQELGYTKVPAFDETALVTRFQAVAKGIKANKTHAAYNPVDICFQLKNLAESMTEELNGNRKVKYNLKALEEITGIGQKSISQYLQLDRLPQDVLDLVGEGKLRYQSALCLLKLDSAEMMSEVASKACAEGWSRRTLEGKVSAILRGEEDTKVCQICKKAFPTDDLNHISACPSCSQEIRAVRSIKDFTKGEEPTPEEEIEPKETEEEKARWEAKRKARRLEVLRAQIRSQATPKPHKDVPSEMPQLRLPKITKERLRRLKKHQMDNRLQQRHFHF